MWLSKRGQNQREIEGTAELGAVTLGGDPAGVYLAGERRDLPVIGPGGYYWKPTPGEQVLVLKTGEQGELPCVTGTRVAKGADGLLPGEVLITASMGKASIKLGLDGSVALTGNVMLNGVPLEARLNP